MGLTQARRGFSYGASKEVIMTTQAKVFTIKMTEAPEEWALIEAYDRSYPGAGATRKHKIGLARTSLSLRAFALTIEKHEQPPVDPLLAEAREIVKATLTPDRHMRCDRRSEIDLGQWDDGQKIRAALAALKRGIEIGQAQ